MKKTGFLCINELKKKLGQFSLGPISLTLKQGEYFVLLGPTGCGKTSFLSHLAGLQGTDKGVIFLGDKDIGCLPPEQRRIGYVMQTGNLFPHLSVKANVAFGLKYLKMTRTEYSQRLDRYLDLFGLTALADRSCLTLSGGETKKTAIARSLIIEPRLLLLDEPLGMLDHNGRKEILQVLKIIHEELHTTTIHVTHDRHETWMTGQTCGVMNQGKIIQTGSVSELFRKPVDLFTAEFFGGMNIFPAKFQGKKAKLSWIDLDLARPLEKEHGWVLIRPENIRVVNPQHNHKTVGKITAVRDLGEYIEIEVQVNEKSRLFLHTSVGPAHCFSTGNTLHLDWAQDSIHTFFQGKIQRNNRG
jgi:ABC-type Fe3+/spermidine/putrescine transport system ATPase subunit